VRKRRLPDSTCLSQNDEQCEHIFRNTHRRKPDGRYSVQLPFKDHKTPDIGLSRDTAVKRFHALEAKFRQNPQFKREYEEVINDYLILNDAEKVTTEENLEKNSNFYLPHHAVIKTESITTKTRVVFDASSRSSNGTSLNDHLLIGPKLQHDLFSILIRFRKHKIAFTADITKMYRMVEVEPIHRDYQRFLWRVEDKGPLETFRLKTVTFGTSSAPYLGVKCLQQTAIDERDNFPLAHDVILTDFYMDDLLSGSRTESEALTMQKQLPSCLASGGFQLHKWASNSRALLPEKANNSSAIINLDKEGMSKTLGLNWDCNRDLLSYKIKIKQGTERLSKRTVLSVIAQLFDPLGLVSPIIVKAKIILQKIWSQNLDWDQEIPEELSILWYDFINTLSELNNVAISRCVISVKNPISVQLVGFADASTAAYGACLFIRAINHNAEISVHLLYAKSRIAPLKTVSIPRLELCAAVLLAQLANKITKTIKIEFSAEYYFTDSTVVLGWLNATPNTWNTFVANRVAEIQRSTDIKNWRHVPTKENPADILSRGCAPNQLKGNSLWLNGPEFLLREPNHWPAQVNSRREETKVEAERRKSVATTLITTTSGTWDVLRRYSSFVKLTLVFAYVLRFIDNAKAKRSETKRQGILTAQEIQNAKIQIFKLTQQEAFPVEIKCLQAKKPLPKSSKLISLNPFMDDHGVVRVGGRLSNAPISYAQKFPVVLPKDHHITELIIDQVHKQQLHAGPQATLAAIRQHYWPLSGRGIVRKRLNRCNRCFRVKPVRYEELMGNLPENRVTMSRVFLNCGIGYAGPILIKEGRGRGKRSVKAYIAIFVCFVTRATHLELVSDCTAEAFVNACKRFMSRRGKPKNIYSDNAGNFKKGEKELNFLIGILKSDKYKSYVKEMSVNDGITWHNIPPRSPHFGGIWEAGVKAMKYHLKRTIGDSVLTFEEMYVLTSVEACLNSRPLTPLSSSPQDLSALTPGHFLIGDSLTAPVEADLSQIPINRLSRWQHVQLVQQRFWRRWSREYMAQLQERSKWRTKSGQQLTIGTLVMIHHDNAPPLRWTLGRVVQVHPGKDDIVRVASVKTKTGVIKRAVQRLCVLPSQ
jgi:hypothetical protein